MRASLSSQPRRSASVSIAAGLALVLASCSAQALFGPAQGAACGAYAAPNHFLLAVTLAAARDYRLALPALGPQAELDSDQPATLVIFEGPMRDSEIRGGRAASPASPLKHVCAILADGTTRIYPNVDVGLLVPARPLPPSAGP